jgi:hypothetical protein
MLGITKFFNENIAPLADLEKIKPTFFSQDRTKCNVCGEIKESKKMVAYMVNGYIKYKCNNHN